MSLNWEFREKVRCLKLGMLRIADFIAFYFNDTALDGTRQTGRGASVRWQGAQQKRWNGGTLTLALAGVPELATCSLAGSAACPVRPLVGTAPLDYVSSRGLTTASGKRVKMNILSALLVAKEEKGDHARRHGHQYYGHTGVSKLICRLPNNFTSHRRI